MNNYFDNPNDLRMSKTQKKLESNLKRTIRNSLDNTIQESQSIYKYNNFYDFYKDAFYHCKPLKNIDYNLYILITDEMIKNAISHNTDEIKNENLKDIIKTYMSELKNINNEYFMNVINH